MTYAKTLRKLLIKVQITPLAQILLISLLGIAAKADGAKSLCVGGASGQGCRPSLLLLVDRLAW
ncbi:hypothetical protein A6X21_19330 [Planctopirus hydrillae]|uniref:Uncharacterized protein n=1 Tax=Planctopirus hydrillae TaxID=1841610 RepID=A0A1C3EH16_9PLAN|nr:hypothetical protein A6X21_19330 [Planctopirus hydrillae]